jgi:hypothetical protein
MRGWQEVRNLINDDWLKPEVAGTLAKGSLDFLRNGRKALTLFVNSGYKKQEELKREIGPSYKIQFLQMRCRFQRAAATTII